MVGATEIRTPATHTGSTGTMAMVTTECDDCHISFVRRWHDARKACVGMCAGWRSPIRVVPVSSQPAANLLLVGGPESVQEGSCRRGDLSDAEGCGGDHSHGHGARSMAWGGLW
jgi:hypothetical protein